MNRYESTWWTLEMPAGWTGKEEDACHTIFPAQGVGAFQLSAYRKDIEVNDQDLREFAGEIPLQAIHAGEFTGFLTRVSEGDTFWIKWWLRAGQTMLHATYNCPNAERNESEEQAVARIVDSLELAR